MDPGDIQNVGERHADPLGYIRPALFTRQLSDLAARRVAFKLSKRKRGGPVNHAVDGELPVSESSGLKALERVIRRCDFVRQRRLRNLARMELTGQRVL